MEPVVALALTEIEIAVAMPDGGGDGDEPQKAEPEGGRVRADGTEKAGDERDGDAEQWDAKQTNAAIIELTNPAGIDLKAPSVPLAPQASGPTITSRSETVAPL